MFMDLQDFANGFENLIQHILCLHYIYLDRLWKVCLASINLVPEESWMLLIMRHPGLPILLNNVLLSTIAEKVTEMRD